MKDISKKRNRIAAIICSVAICIMLVCSFFALSTGATEFDVYDGVQIFNNDDLYMEDQSEAGFYQFSENLKSDYLAYPYFYIVARWNSNDDPLPLNWLLSNYEETITYDFQVVNANNVINPTGEYQIIKLYYNGVITNSFDEFMIVNYLGGSSDGEAITARDFACLAVLDPSVARYDEFESWLTVNVLNVLNSSNSFENGIINMNLVLGAFEQGEFRGYDRGYNEGKVFSKDYWFDYGKTVGLTQGALDEYMRVITEDKPQWVDDAYESGKAAGYVDGVKSAKEFNPQKVPFAIMDAIGSFFQGMLNVELFGINLFGVFTAILTIGVGVFVFKKVL